MGTLIPLSRICLVTSPPVCQSQSGLPYSHRGGECNVHSLLDRHLWSNTLATPWLVSPCIDTHSTLVPSDQGHGLRPRLTLSGLLSNALVGGGTGERCRNGVQKQRCQRDVRIHGARGALRSGACGLSSLLNTTLVHLSVPSRPPTEVVTSELSDGRSIGRIFWFCHLCGEELGYFSYATPSLPKIGLTGFSRLWNKVRIDFITLKYPGLISSVGYKLVAQTPWPLKEILTFKCKQLNNFWDRSN